MKKNSDSDWKNAMIIDFNTLEEKTIDHFNGGEGKTIARMFLDDKNRIMKGKLEPGCSIGLHRHENNSEILYVISGKGKVLIDGEYESVCSGIVHYCPKGHEHSLINNSDSDLEFVCVVPFQ